MKALHLVVLVASIIITPIAVFWEPLRDSVPYLVFISNFAVVYTAVTGYQAHRAEEAADDAETIAQRVLDKLEERGAFS